MLTRVGVLGLSPGNGHPFSYSSIINGYSDKGLSEAGWPVIYDYVRCRHASDFGVGDLKVTHAWTQEPSQTSALCLAANIEHAVKSPADMLGEVDAVIIARDDHTTHRYFAEPFLEAGIPALIDKPLTLNKDDLDYFIPCLEAGMLMSCSSMRYAKELDAVKNNISGYGDLRLVRGTIINDWERYGVHLLDAIFPLMKSRPVSVRAVSSNHDSVVITMSDGTPVVIDALHEAPKIFRVEAFGTQKISSHDITDNFSMFRRLLWEFWSMIRHKRPPYSPKCTVDVISTLIAGKQALQSGNEVAIDVY
ncbi:Predicted dehydrogenase [Modicisalibacter muralis]|uniref:Predicted dehydrogenase n=1 Tax=Modicisalibacter muralis TaxID=119000 RepID=A0A1G9EW46_9GAMM|nr:Gfo/Idh/MocA family oxidoreductase [Halomonas muralis]SDK80341.1 Predicted dehydrogenase [Halomonas muralis]